MKRISKAPQERRKEILDTALELFLRNGYARTSVSDIVQKLNVAQGLFYYYFKSKEEVFCAALEQYTEEFIMRLEAIIRDKETPLFDRIKQVIGVMNTMFSQTELVMMDGIQSKEQLDLDYRLSITATQALIEPVSDILEDLKQKGMLNIKNSKSTASFLVFGIFGLIHGNPNGLHNNAFLDPTDILDLMSRVLGVSAADLLKI